MASSAINAIINDLGLVFKKDVPIVDTNIRRVLVRVFWGKPKLHPLDSQIWTLAEELLPKGKTYDFNQSPNLRIQWM